MTPVTLKLESRSHGASLTCVLPWCTSVTSLVFLGQIFLEILSENGFGKNDPCDLENEVKVMQNKLELCPSMVHLYTKFGDPKLNIFEIICRNSFCKNDPCDLEIGVKVTQGELYLCPSMVHLCTHFGNPRSNNSGDIERKPFFAI